MQHILVCDDERDIVAALKIYLESDGYCVHTAYSGEEALRGIWLRSMKNRKAT